MIESFYRIFALIRKELLAILKDPKSRITVFVSPVLQCLLFGYAASYNLNHVPYAVLDQDHSAASRALIASIDHNGAFERVVTLGKASQIAEQITNKRVTVAVVINKDFERQLMAGKTAQVQVIADGRNTNTAGTAQGYLSTITADFAKNNTLSNRFDKPLTAYLDYYVRRYYLSAIDSFNVISTIKRMVCAYIVTAYELERSNNPTQTEVVKILQGYSKEVEHSYENGELLEDEFIFNPLFLTDNLIGIL